MNGNVEMLMEIIWNVFIEKYGIAAIKSILNGISLLNRLLGHILLAYI